MSRCAATFDRRYEAIVHLDSKRLVGHARRARFLGNECSGGDIVVEVQPAVREWSPSSRRESHWLRHERGLVKHEVRSRIRGDAQVALSLEDRHRTLDDLAIEVDRESRTSRKHPWRRRHLERDKSSSMLFGLGEEQLASLYVGL